MGSLTALAIVAAYVGVFFAGLGILLLGVSQLKKADIEEKSKLTQS